VWNACPQTCFEVAGQMNNRMEMLEAALDLLDEGVAVLDGQSGVVFWNKAAAALTGHRPADMLSRPLPGDLYRVDSGHLRQSADAAAEARARGDADKARTGFGGAVIGYADGLRAAVPVAADAMLERPALVAMRHHQGHTLPAMLRRMPLRDALGEQVGAALLFYAVEAMDGLPHGASGEGVGVERSQADMEDRLDDASHQWAANGVPFGLLWLTVDQAAGLRRTHGRDACEAMLGIVEQTLVRGLRPSETIGRWGNDEFLVLCHERTTEMLVEHAHRLAGLARTAEFRWWGDRVNLTVSIGTGQATEGETLLSLLNRVQQAMQAGSQAGGNQVTQARGQACSQS
jgi:diguanylate cyclase (GGDEF)-like protein